MNPSESIDIIRPVLKWAGGKRWFAERHLHHLPSFSGRYIEPFVGSGAVFFALQPRKAILSDANSELIKTYQAVKHRASEVHQLLAKHAAKHNDRYYYQVRNSEPTAAAAQAARFIYLNRTCWNGLYRVNLQGKFNVPRGTKDSVLLASDDFSQWSKLLRRAQIYCADFEKTIDTAVKGDLLFVDPPYTVRHNNNGFVKYNQNIFSWSDQVRLSRALIRASQRGVRIVSTNAAHLEVERLYRDKFAVAYLQRASVIAADPKRRGKYSELLITNH